MNLYEKTEILLNSYKIMIVEIKNINLEIESMKEEYTGCGAISLDEKSSPTNAFTSTVENEVVTREKRLYQLEKLKREDIKTIAKIDNAIVILSPLERHCIEMICFKSMQYKEVSKELSIDYSYVGEVKHRAIDKISHLVCI